MQSIKQDIRYALRTWRQNSFSTLAAFLILSLGIGATTAMFSIVNGVLLQRIPAKYPDRIVSIFDSEKHLKHDSVSMQDIDGWKRQLQSFEALAVYRPGLSNMIGGEDAVLATTLECDADMFRVLGVEAARGRSLLPEDNAPGHDQAIMLSWAFWQSRFGGGEVIGRTFRLDDKMRVIVGILPRNLNVLGHQDVWLPAVFDFTNPNNTRGHHSYHALGLLREGVSRAKANVELERASAQLAAEYPAENRGVNAYAISLREFLSGDLQTPLLLLLTAVTAVLLIACGNVANLLLARSSARLREISVRFALGAQRYRLFQQLLTESLLLAFVSALAGLGLAAGAVDVVRNLPSIGLARPEDITLDWHVLLFVMGTGGATGVLFGLMPAARVVVLDIQATLKQAGGRVSDSKRHQLLRRCFIAIETAVATLLLILSLLLLKSFQNATKVQLGFRPDHLISLYASLPPERYLPDSARGARFADQVLQGVRALPGVQNAAFTQDLPFVNGMGSTQVRIQGKPAAKSGFDSILVEITGITSGYRRTLEIPLLEGRDLTNRDDVEKSQAVLVNEAFAKQLLPGEDPVGKRVSYIPGRPDWHEIVGVVANSVQQGVEKPIAPAMYVPLYRWVTIWPALVVRTAGDPRTYTQELHKQIQHVDNQVAIFQARTMEEIIKEQLGWRTFETWLLAAFAVFGLALSSLGIYAVASYSVLQRTSEIGVRMALGATKEQIAATIVRQGVTPAIIGALAGTIATRWVAQLFSALLFGVKFSDAAAYLAAVVFLIVVAAAASYFPARKAAATDPLAALRYE